MCDISRCKAVTECQLHAKHVYSAIHNGRSILNFCKNFAIKKRNYVQVLRYELALTLQHATQCRGEPNMRESSFMIHLQFTEKAVHTGIRQSANVIYTRETSPINIAIPEKISSSARVSLSYTDTFYLSPQFRRRDSVLAFATALENVAHLHRPSFSASCRKSQWKHIERPPVFLKSTMFTQRKIRTCLN